MAHAHSRGLQCQRCAKFNHMALLHDGHILQGGTFTALLCDTFKTSSRVMDGTSRVVGCSMAAAKY